MITLIIKGDMVAASLAASAHSVKLYSMATSNYFREVIASAEPGYMTNIVSWFCENPAQAGDGYPAGTLLFYSERKE